MAREVKNIIDFSPTAYYRFSSGSLTTDEERFFNLTNIGSPTETTGVFSGGVLLAGSDAFSINNSSILQPLSITIAGWFKTTTTGAIQGLYQSYSQNTDHSGFKLYINANNLPEFLMGASLFGDAYYTCTAQTNITTGEWFHIAATYDSNTMIIYVNGVEEGRTTTSSNVSYALTNYIRLGCLNDSGTNKSFFAGSADDVFTISNLALDSTTIHDIYYGNTLVANVSNFNLTGIDVLFKRTYAVLMSVANFNLTGVNIRLLLRQWKNRIKPVTTWSTRQKPTTTFTTRTKPTTTWTNRVKP